MQLKYNYWYFKKILSSDFCDKIIDLSKSKQKQVGLIGNEDQKEEKKLLSNKKYLKKLSQKRNSNIVWLNETWIYSVINEMVNTANVNAGWNFQWDYNEPCQFTIYKKGQHYDWHVDSYNEPYNRPDDQNIHGKIRKLSCVISLSNPKDYKGGNFLFQLNHGNEKDEVYLCNEIKEKGSIIVFPSFIKHKVEPVTSGTRYSLVNWCLGRPFV
jgi:PKHD-type hydroxylase